jgi:chromosome segregation ATPase
MTGKRFVVEKYSVRDISIDEKYVNSRYYIGDKGIAQSLCDLLNELAEENEELKQAYAQLKHRHSLLHDECIDAECDRDSYRKDIASLEKENEQLKQINRNLQDFRNFITEKNVSNEKQRKELQLQMLRLYNYFENYFEDAMSPNAFSEMWDNVKEDKKWERR